MRAQAGEEQYPPAERVAVAADLPPRVVYEARIEIRGFPEDAALAAVKFRAFLRRFLKPAGLTIKITDEHNRLERTRT